MVGVAGPAALMAVERSGVAAASNAAWEEKWEVEFSRFFNFPSRSSYSFVSLSLKPLPKAKTRAKGTWLTASSAAVLRLGRSHADFVPVLSVRVLGWMLEEHFISNLNILWPQVSCASECPTRGSRVIFFSYKDVSNQVQKFAVRFSASSMVQHFLNAVKECSSDVVDVGLPGSDFLCENSTPSDLITSNGFQHRNDEESSFSELAARASVLPVLTLPGGESKCSRQPLLANNIETFSALPPSFSELLNDCSTELAQQMPAAEGDRADRDTEKPTSISSLNAVSVAEVLNTVEQQVLVDDVDLRSQIEKYMSDASFNDMLAKIEMVIDELGGDLAL